MKAPSASISETSSVLTFLTLLLLISHSFLQMTQQLNPKQIQSYHQQSASCKIFEHVIHHDGG